MNTSGRLTRQDALILARLPLARKLVLRDMHEGVKATDYRLMKIHTDVRVGGWPIAARNELRVKMTTLRIDTERARHV